MGSPVIQPPPSRCPVKFSFLLFCVMFLASCSAIDETSAVARTYARPSRTCYDRWEPRPAGTFDRLSTPTPLSAGEILPQRSQGYRWLPQEPARVDFWRESFCFTLEKKKASLTRERTARTAPAVHDTSVHGNKRIPILNPGHLLRPPLFIPFGLQSPIGRTVQRATANVRNRNASSCSLVGANPCRRTAREKPGSRASAFLGRAGKCSSFGTRAGCSLTNTGLTGEGLSVPRIPLVAPDQAKEVGESPSTASEKNIPVDSSSAPSEVPPAENTYAEGVPPRPAATEVSSRASVDFPSEEKVSFPRIGIFPDFAEALAGLGVTQATEIQQLAIPAILGGLDTVIGAETGSGKTLGYVVGVVQNILIQKMIHEKKEDAAMMEKKDLPIPRHHPYAVVIVPTRELALQVVAWVRRLCRRTTITAQLMLGTYTQWPFGTLSIPTSPDLVVCTPSVLAPFARGTKAKALVPFREIQMVVLDEADMLLDGGGYKECMDAIFTAFRKADQQLLREKRRRTQYVFAAATIPDRGPKSVKSTITSLCPKATFFCTRSLHRHREKLEQEFVEVPSGASEEDRMALLLTKLRKLSGKEKVMIFCNTAQTAQRVLKTLEKEIPASRPKLFSSEIDQKDRAFNLGLFSRGRSRVLVCTDAASRGLDIVGVTLVVQYDFALSAVSHLHRVGRVARARQSGRALNFFSADQKTLVGIVQQAARDPHSTSVAAAFSRRRSFRKKIRAQKENCAKQPQSEGQDADTAVEAQ